MNDLYHKCQSQQHRGDVVPLELSQHRSVIKPRPEDINTDRSVTVQRPEFEYYENWECRACGHVTMKLVLKK